MQKTDYFTAQMITIIHVCFNKNMLYMSGSKCYGMMVLFTFIVCYYSISMLIFW